MSRWEFMSQLEKLLLYVPIQEREEALQYYNDYFEDAGPENEQEVIQALGSPEKVAENIKRDFNQNYFGVAPDKVEAGKEIVSYNPNREIFEEPMRKGDKSNLSTWVKILIVVCAAPVLFGVISSIIGGGFGVLAGVVGTLFGLVVAFGLVGLTCSVVSLAIITAGIATCTTSVLGGLGIIGVGMIVMALGILGFLMEVMLVGKWIPGLVKLIAQVIRRLLKKG